MRILVTGANGQLGNEMRIIARNSSDTFVFTDVNQVENLETEYLDITDLSAIRALVAERHIDAIVNCAAYTNVDAAESNEALAEKLNAQAPENLAIAMREVDGWLIHISTDYVFGKEPYNTPCKEDQKGTPTGIYGLTKLHGEQRIMQTGCHYIIIRTAWLYSEFGKNFCKTMLNLTANKPELKVVFDQVGTPTYALDLAKAIVCILAHPVAGIYHYSNEGVCSWFDFTKMIQEYSGQSSCEVLPCHSFEFPSPVTRPSYSVLDKTKIKETFGLSIPYWTNSLKQCICNMKRTLSVLILLLALHVSAYAITDQEILSQVLTMYQNGMDEMSIAKQLIAEGATLEQLQKVRQQATMATSAKNVGSTIENAQKQDLRVNNGESINLELLFAMPQDEGKQVFGRDIFRKSEKGFEPQMNQATPQNYKLGAGDEVIIDIYGATQLQMTHIVSPDGKITVDNYGPIQLGGLTIQEATRRLKSTLGTRYQNCHILLSLGQTRSIAVNVMGEVEVPGTYQLSAFADVFNALYIAGGVRESGTLRDIKIYRAGSQVGSIDIYGYLMNGELTGNIRLEDQDVIIVGTYQEMVQITGNVKRPMFYEMKAGETLDKLLYYAGGFSGDAYTDAISVARKNNGAQSFNTIINEHFGHFALMDGDSVNVQAILPRLQNTVEIQGAVFRPGFYGLDDNLRTIKQLIAMADGPSEDAFIGRAILYRMKLDRTYQAMAIDLKGILEGTDDDVVLKNEDQLFIPSKKNELERQKVTIHGEVYLPDTYTYAENESVEDLILRAGGLTEKASTSKVDISRRVFDPKAKEESTIKTETFTVELNDNMGVGEHGFILQPFDEVYVRVSPGYGTQMNVSIRGEVLFSGTYAMKTKNDRISDLVRSAGGLSRDADARGARLQRIMTDDERRRRDQLMKISKNEKESSNIELNLELDTTYWVGIDLEKALAHPGSDDDLVLRENDVLVIPNINNTVKINGEVLYPNTVSYREGKRANYYIDMAGGYGNHARRARAFIIYSNGKVAPARYGKIQPGCEIVVPTKPERKTSNAAQWVSIASASASMASVVATIVAVIRK